MRAAAHRSTDQWRWADRDQRLRRLSGRPARRPQKSDSNSTGQDEAQDIEESFVKMIMLIGNGGDGNEEGETGHGTVDFNDNY